MPVVKLKPTSPGRRAVVRVTNPDLYKGRPFAALVEAQSKTAGRNNNGHITTRHRGGGHKQHYRLIDFRRNDKDGIAAKVERIEYDPNRSAHIALLCYADGERRYIIAPKGLAVGQSLMSGAQAPIRPGNTLPLRNIPVGSTIHCIEMLPGKGAQLARSAGGSAQLLAREGTYAQVRLRSGEIRRWRGIRPTVRGVAMNPIDHPHGGGEGRTGEAQAPVSPWGTPTKGFKTRRNKRTTSMIVTSRHKRK